MFCTKDELQKTLLLKKGRVSLTFNFKEDVVNDDENPLNRKTGRIIDVCNSSNSGRTTEL